MWQKSLRFLKFDVLLKSAAQYLALGESYEQFLSQVPEIEEDKVKTLIEESTEALSLVEASPFPALFDISNPKNSVLKSQKNGILTIPELLNIGRVLENSRKLKNYYKNQNGPLESYFKSLFILVDVKSIITNSIDGQILSDKASEELLNIRQKTRSLDFKIRKILSNMLNSPSYKKYIQEKFVSIKNNRYVLPIKYEERSNFPGIAHEVSSSNNTIFVEPSSIIALNNELCEYKSKEKYEILRILKDLTQTVCQNSEEIVANYENMLKLDIIFARAKYARFTSSIRPKISRERIIKLTSVRHPLLFKAVPLDFEINSKVLVITGPNTGGKSVALATLGLVCSMFQSGFFVPSDYAELPIFKNIFADIGDGQDIEQNVSTFSSHMKSISQIFKKNKDDSLILLDEIGSGTDPKEGAALAVSILDYLKNTDSLTIATTHYPEVKIYSTLNENVANASFELDHDTLEPTYKLICGFPGRSYGFEISEKLGIPKSIIENAKACLGGSRQKFEDTLREIEKNRLKIEKKEKETAALNVKIKQIYNELKLEKDKILSKAKNELGDAKNEIAKALFNVVGESQEILKKIKAESHNKNEEKFHDSLQLIRHELSKNIKHIRTLKNNKNANYQLENFKKGDEVFVLSMNDVGAIEKINQKQNTVSVKIRNILVQTEISNIRFTKIEDLVPKSAFEDKLPIKIQKLKNKKQSFVKSELDVRGKYRNDAINELEIFLNDAIMSNLSIVSVIHGKGAGVLKNAVHTFLRNSHYVKSFRIGEFGEGDTGVTIIEL